jgi:hypothetical protein
MRHAAALLTAIALLEGCGLPEGGLGSDSGPDVTAADVVTDVVDEDGGVPIDAPADVAEEISPADPSQLSGLQLWLIADRGLDAGGDGDAGEASAPTQVVSWLDQSPNAYVAHVSIGSAPPTVQSTASYGSNATVSFQPTATLTIDSVASIPQPFSVFIVGEAFPGGASNRYFFNTTLNSAIYRGAAPSAPQDSMQIYAGLASNAPTGVVTSPSVSTCVVDGINSAIYLSSNQATPAITGPNSFGGGVTIGSFLPADPTYSLGGHIAELAVFSGTLPQLDVKRLNLYATNRYGITITP